MPFHLIDEKPGHFIAHNGGSGGAFKIAKKMLTPAKVEQFRKMCKGGAVRMDEGGEVKEKTPEPKPEEHAPGWNVADKINELLPEWLSARTAVHKHNAQLEEADRSANMARGGQVQRFDDGGSVYDPFMSGQLSQLGGGAPSPDVSRLGHETASPAGGSWFPPAPPPPPEWLAGVGGARDTAPGEPASQAGQLASLPPPPPPPAAAPAPAAPPAPTQVGAGGGPLSPGQLQVGGMSAQQMQMYNPYGGIMGQLQGAERMQERGIRGQAEAAGRAAEEQARAQQAHQQLLQQHEQAYQQHLDALTKEHDNITADVQNSHIDPSRVWSNKSTAQKAGAVLGMILGGMGGGLTGQPNAALGVLQKQIDRDIEAQKAELGKKESLLADNFRQTGNLFHAEQLTRLQMSAALEGQIKLAALRSGSQTAQAQADQAIGQARQSLIGPMMQIAQTQAMYSMMRSQSNEQGYVPSAASRPMFTGKPEEFLKDRNERRLELPELGPGAHTYAKSGKDAEEIGKSFSSLSNIQRQVQHLGAIVKQHSTAIHVPGSAASAQYNATASSLVTG